MIVKHGLVPESDPLDSLDRWDWDDDDELFIVFLENDDDDWGDD